MSAKTSKAEISDSAPAAKAEKPKASKPKKIKATEVKLVAEAPAPVEAAPAPKPTETKAAAPKAEKPKAAKPKAEKPKAEALKAEAQPAPKADTKPAVAKPAAESPKAATADAAGEEMVMPDVDQLSRNLAHMVENSGRALAAMIKPAEKGEVKTEMSPEVEEAVKSIGKVAESWWMDPTKSVQAQTALSTGFVNLWAHTLRRMSGENEAPIIPVARGDKRFAAPEWNNYPFFDFLRQAYSFTNKWAEELIDKAEGVDAHTRDKAHFYLNQIASALSPSNFVLTNPEILKATIESNGENLVRGTNLLAEDMEAGEGSLKIRQTDLSKYKVGENMAMTPGKVVYRNDLMELIQYSPQTETVFKRPLLIVPPWINKFYVLDLNPEKSYVRWCVAQGLTVFIISWINPDERHRNKSFESYMKEGVLTALDQIEIATGEKDVSAVGYCVGGTMLSVTLAYMAAIGDNRISSATLFTTQVDFRYPGDLRVFVDEAQIRAVEEKMKEKGYLDGSKMASAFNMLRPNDLIWSYFVNNYMRGKAPSAFDLLTWNSDSTRMTEANHSWYLRNCYLDNNLTKGKMEIGGQKLDLGKVKIPIYDLAAREDHIAPAKSVFIGAQYFGGEVNYVLAGSGHIAGVVNPADKPKYQYWKGERPSGEFDAWVEKATEYPGSWWVDWIKWIEDQAPEKVPAREPGGGKLKPLCDAPGEYVKIKC